MLQKTKGIVLKTIRQGETSLIVKLFTADFGILTYSVKGVRSAKGKGKIACFQPLTILQIETYYRANKAFQILKEYKPHPIFLDLPFNPVKSCVAFFLAEVLHKCIKEEQENHPLYNFLEERLVTLDQTDFNPLFHVQFLIDLSQHLGFGPSGFYEPEAPYFNLQDGSFETLPPPDHLNMPELVVPLFSDLLNQPETVKTAHARERKILLNTLLDYYMYHIDGFGKIKSLEILKSVLHS